MTDRESSLCISAIGGWHFEVPVVLLSVPSFVLTLVSPPAVFNRGLEYEVLGVGLLRIPCLPPVLFGVWCIDGVCILLG